MSATALGLVLFAALLHAYWNVVAKRTGGDARFALIAALFLVAGYAALRSRFLSADPVTRDLGLTIAACLVVPLVGSFTFDLLSFHTVTGISFLLVGAAGALLRAVGDDQLAPSQASGPTIEVTR